MPRLSDSFPRKERLDYAKRNLVPGVVLHMYNPHIKHPKLKYHILAAMAESPLVILISTDMPSFANSRPNVKRCQVLMRASDHPFLEHDSYADCGRVLDKISEHDILKCIVENTDCVRGELPAETCKEIAEAVWSSKSVSMKHKKSISIALGRRITTTADQ